MKWPWRIVSCLLRRRRAAILFSCGPLSNAPGPQILRGSSGKSTLPFVLLLSRCKKNAHPWLSRGKAHRFIDCNKFKPQVTPARKPVLQSLHRRAAVGIQKTVVSVVQAKNLAVPCLYIIAGDARGRRSLG